jgi:hypothetical protein
MHFTPTSAIQVPHLSTRPFRQPIPVSRSVLRAAQPHHEGFSADTEVLTDSGWKSFADLDRTEAVATVNLVTDQIQYQYPTAYADGLYDGEMIALRGKRIDALVTPNHRMITCPSRSIWKRSGRTLLKPAGKLSLSLALKSQATWIGTSDSVVVPTRDEESTLITGRILAADPR